jgi:3,4-dihydroxy 2-butanone 4-phosphate synthase/GTP cyclohydrolase II
VLVEGRQRRRHHEAGPELREFADEHGLGDDLDRRPGPLPPPHENLVERVAETAAARPGTATSRPTATGSPWTAPSTSLWCTATVSGSEPVLTRVHSECLTGDVFGQRPLRLRPAARRGARAHRRGGSRCRRLPARPRGPGDRPGREAAGLPAQDGGRDTVDANLDLGLPADARHYGTATQVLRDLGISTVRLMTNNPDNVDNLEDFGIQVSERVPLTPHPNDHNIAYLLTKRDRMGHDLPNLAGEAADLAKNGA